MNSLRCRRANASLVSAHIYSSGSIITNNYSVTVRTKSSGWPWHQHQGKPSYRTYFVHMVINSTPGFWNWIPADVFHTNDKCSRVSRPFLDLVAPVFYEKNPARSRILLLRSTHECSSAKKHNKSLQRTGTRQRLQNQECRSSHLAYQLSGDLPS